MATAKNKLPTFGASAEIDDSIVNNESNLKDTGFQPNTTIKSAEMNTYMKMLINGMSGLIDSVYNSGVSQGEIKATSSADDVKNYIVAGLNQIIKTNKVDNATHADEATNVDNIVNNDIGSNANVKFAIGDKSFSKVVNNVAHAANAEKLDSVNIGDSSHPVYFDANGKPVECTGISLPVEGEATSAQKLTTARTIALSGDVSGSTSFDGSKNVTINTNIVNAKSTQLVDSSSVGLDAGDTSHPVYFEDGKPVTIDHIEAENVKVGRCTLDKILDGIDVNNGFANSALKLVDSMNQALDIGSSDYPVYFNGGTPVVITGNIANGTSGNAATASKLATERTISLTGDVTGSVQFDGSANVSITVDVKKSAALDSTNIGDTSHPVYFDATGEPAQLENTFFNAIANPFKSAALENGRISLSKFGILSEHTIEVIYADSSTTTNQVSFGVISNKRLADDENDATKLGIHANSGRLMRVIDTGEYLYVEAAATINSDGTVSFGKAFGVVYVRELESYM